MRLHQGRLVLSTIVINLGRLAEVEGEDAIYSDFSHGIDDPYAIALFMDKVINDARENECMRNN